MTHHKYTEIDLDKSVTVRFLTIYNNSLVLYFKFYDADKNQINVTNTQFTFTVTDVGKTVNHLQIENADFSRPEVYSIKYTVPSLDMPADTYKVDFTAIFADGRKQTLMDGEFIVRDRYVYNG